MKEYFQKIVAWAKAHPWLAAGILGGIVVLIWLALRNGWFGGGGSGEAVAVPSGGDSGTAAVPDLSSLPDTSALPAGVSEIGQSSTPIPVSLPSVGASLPDMGSIYSDLGGASYPVDSGYMDMSYAAGAPVASAQGASLAEVSSASPSASIGGGFFSGDVSYGSTKDVLPSNIQTVAAPSLFDKLMQPIDLRPAEKKASGKKNAAQLAGKGKNFTGYIDGVYYYKGTPAASSSAAASTKVAPSAGSKVAPSAGGGFFTGEYLDPTVKQKSSLTSKFKGSV